MKTRAASPRTPRVKAPDAKPQRGKAKQSLGQRIIGTPRSKPEKPTRLDLTREERAELIARRLMARCGPPITAADYCQLNAAISIKLDGAPTDCRDVLDRALSISASWPGLGPDVRIDVIDTIECAFYQLMGRKPAL